MNNGVVFQEHTWIECDDDGYGGDDEDNDDDGDDATDKRTAVTTRVKMAINFNVSSVD